MYSLSKRLGSMWEGKWAREVWLDIFVGFTFLIFFYVFSFRHTERFCFSCLDCFLKKKKKTVKKILLLVKSFFFHHKNQIHNFNKTILRCPRWVLGGRRWIREQGMGERPGPSHVPFIEVGGEAAMASGCPAAPARAAAAPAARPAAAPTAAGRRAPSGAAAARTRASVHCGHRGRCCRSRCCCCRRCWGQVGAALWLCAGGHQPRGCGRLVARAGSRGGLGALRGGLMDLHVLPQRAGMRVGLVTHLAEIGLI